MKNYTFVREHPDHFLLHNGTAHFKVAKEGLSEPTADKIRALAKGGEAEDSADKTDQLKTYNTNSYDPNKPYTDNSGHGDVRYRMPSARPENPNKQYNIAAGGQVKKDTALENPPPADLDYTPTPLPTPEPPQKRRQIESEMPEPQAKANGGEIQNYDEGGQTQAPPIDPDKAQSAQDSMRKAFGYSEGGKMGAPQQTSSPDPTPTPTAPPAANPQVTDMFHGAFGNRQPASENKAGGGPVASNAVKDISHETQKQAIGRYAAGNPANMAKGGGVQNHFHFYQGGAPGPSPLDQYEGDVPNPGPAPTALDDYTKMAQGGNPPPTALDNYVNLADPSGTVGDEAALQLSAKDVDPSAVVNPDYNKPTELQQEMDAASQGTATDPESSAKNLAGAATMANSGPVLASSAEQVAPSRPEAGNGSVVAPQNQISLSAKAAVPGQDKGLLAQFDANNTIIADAVKQGDINTARGLEAQNEVLKDQANKQQKMYEDYRSDQYENTMQNNELYKNIMSNKVDPSRYWNNKGPFGKALAGIGLILGGASSGLTGRSNPALDVIQNAIKEDINAQMNDRSNANNLYKMGLERYKDRNSAYQFAQMHLNTTVLGQLQQQANSTNSQAARLAAGSAAAVLGNQNAQFRNELSLTDAAMKAMSGPQTSQQGGVDQNKSLLLTKARFIPKEEQSAVDKESDDYEKLSKVLNHTDDVFSTLSQNANYRQRTSDALPLGSHIPTVTASSKNYEAVSKDWLGNITKETEGRVTPADVDLMRPSLPQAGDSPEVVRIKINNIKDQIREKYAFNTLYKYHLLSPTDSVSSLSSARRKRFNETPVK